MRRRHGRDGGDVNDTGVDGRGCAIRAFSFSMMRSASPRDFSAALRRRRTGMQEGLAMPPRSPRIDLLTGFRSSILVETLRRR